MEVKNWLGLIGFQFFCFPIPRKQFDQVEISGSFQKFYSRSVFVLVVACLYNCQGCCLDGTLNLLDL